MKKNALLFSVIALIANFCYGRQIENTKAIEEKDTSSKHLSMNTFMNSLIYSPDGTCYLIQNNSLYHLCNHTGDGWCKISKDIIRLSIDPINPKIFYAISADFKVKKSLDGGNNWIVIENGLPSDFKANFVFLNPHCNSEVFVSSSSGLFYKTNDAGFTWIKQDTPYFYINDYLKNVYYSVSAGKLLLSNDAGISWKVISDNLPKILVNTSGRTSEYENNVVTGLLPICKPSGSVLIIFTNNGFYKSTDDGNNWISVKDKFPSPREITSIFTFKNELYFGCSMDVGKTGYEAVLLKSDTTLLKWEKYVILGQEMGRGITGIFKQQDKPGIFIRTENNRIAYIDKEKNIIGLNYGLTPHSKVLAFNISWQAEKKVFYAIIANNSLIDVDNYGLWSSTDDGKSWSKRPFFRQEMDNGNFRSIAISPHNSKEIWAFDNGYSSVTYGTDSNWYDIKKDVLKSSYIQDIDFDIKNSNILYWTGYDGLYRYDKSTKNATQLFGSSNTRAENSLLIARDGTNRIFTSRGTMSADGGWTWENILPESLVNKICYFTSFPNLKPLYANNDKIIYLVSFNNHSSEVIISSIDNGKSWNCVGDVLEGSENSIVSFISLDNKLYLFKFCENVEGINGENDGLVIYQSVNEGESWTPIYTLNRQEISNYLGFEATNLNTINKSAYIHSFFLAERDNKLTFYLSIINKSLIYSEAGGEKWEYWGGRVQ